MEEKVEILGPFLLQSGKLFFGKWSPCHHCSSADYRKWLTPERYEITKLSRLMTKQTKWNVPPAKTQISLGIGPVWSESSLSAWRMLGPLATHWTHSEDSDDWADAQADLGLRWVHSRFVGFVMRWLKFGVGMKTREQTGWKSRNRIEDLGNNKTHLMAMKLWIIF